MENSTSSQSCWCFFFFLEKNVIFGDPFRKLDPSLKINSGKQLTYSKALSYKNVLLVLFRALL